VRCRRSRGKTPPNFPRRAHRTKPDMLPEAATIWHFCRVELRWTDQRRVAAPDGARPALRVRQQRHAAFAPGLHNVIDAEVWRKTAWVKLLVQGRRDRPSPRKSIPVILFAHQHLVIAWGGHTLCPYHYPIIFVRVQPIFNKLSHIEPTVDSV
jgi:hypothetical protein